jgi:gluconokinase
MTIPAPSTTTLGVTPEQPNLVVMGVAGCGKSLIGHRLAQALGVVSVEGDAFHSKENIARMSAGIALTDADRAQWLAQLSAHLHQARLHGPRIVLSCSALKRRYRDVLRAGDAQVIFVYLRGTRALIDSRMAARSNHFMPLTLLDSQFRDLEEPQDDENALSVDISAPPERIVAEVVAALGLQKSPPVR